MACGTPVVTSLPEVVGDAALTVGPTDEAALAAAIRQALTDEPFRARLRIAGLARAAMFSWERTAAETLRVYREELAYSASSSQCEGHHRRRVPTEAGVESIAPPSGTA